MIQARQRCLWEGCSRRRVGGNAGKFCGEHAIESKRASQRNWRRKDRKAVKKKPARQEVKQARASDPYVCPSHELAMRLLFGKA